ncbi:MAG: peptide chain release factor N(5)-glutamine methyltransferase [Verrucomicrobia bacterium]|nr:peptide chain release factor N(5)-glutamine methyltransferase [Verrucomicrobiota bacterium]MBU1910672.1 peptide chain release factor N(5)-glutamine methyltransferase [Verrucomicrobiota bacterium]
MAEPTVLELLASAARRLEVAGIEEARLKAEWAMSRVLGCRRLELPLRSREPLVPPAFRSFEAAVQRLAIGEPLQYVLGDVEFMGLVLKTDPRALIPRPETELLVETVLACRPLWDRARAPFLADVGTGTGCVVLALASRRPAARYLARDLNRPALDLARENAIRLGLALRIEWAEGDLLEGVPAASLDAVVSNAPYVPTAQWETLTRSIREFEPRTALDGGPDGLAVIRRLLPQTFTTLVTEGIVFLEIGDGQAGAVQSLMAECGFADIQARLDLSGRERVVFGAKR